MFDTPKNKEDGSRTDTMLELMQALRASVMDIEALASVANRAADRHRSRLTALELELDDSGIIASETAVYLEIPRSQNSSPD